MYSLQTVSTFFPIPYAPSNHGYILTFKRQTDNCVNKQAYELHLDSHINEERIHYLINLINVPASQIFGKTSTCL